MTKPLLPFHSIAFSHFAFPFICVFLRHARFVFAFSNQPPSSCNISAEQSGYVSRVDCAPALSGVLLTGIKRLFVTAQPAFNHAFEWVSFPFRNGSSLRPRTLIDSRFTLILNENPDISILPH